jgi:uncharacterized protein involved in type VI secretion and phage assembly
VTGQQAELTQTNRRIKITTVLDKGKQPGEDDPLLPAIAQCSEAISAPYYIDLLMYGKKGLNIKPEQLINTQATVSFRIQNFVREHQRGEPTQYTYQLRKGVFQTFQRQESFHRRVGFDHNNVDVYTARLVPAFMIMDQEVRYRIFEEPGMTLKNVMDACMTRFKGLDLSKYVDYRNLTAELPKMAHCVQYGESTFNFLSRLMNRFSIWYYFDHETNPAAPHESLVLGTGPVPVGGGSFKACAISDNYPDPRNVEEQAVMMNWQIVKSLARNYAPAPRLTRTSDFNTLAPTNPMESNDESANTQLAKEFDIIANAGGTDMPWSQVQQCELLPETTFIQEAFPDSTIYTDDDASGDAQTTMQVAEGQVFTVSAASKNASFCAAKRFTYQKGYDNPKSTDYLITRMSINAFDKYYLQYVHHDSSLRALLDDILATPLASLLNQLGGSNAADLSNSMAAAGLQEYTQSYIENPSAKQTPFTSYFMAGVVGYLTALLPGTTTILKDVLGLFLGFLTLIVETIRHIVDAVLLLPGFLIPGVKRAREAMDHAITQFERNATEKIEQLLAYEDDGCSVSFVAAPLDVGAFGVALPSARNAQVFGPHLATVIGPKGIDMQAGEIWGDALGRVRVRFPWDRTPWEGGDKNFASQNGSTKAQFLVGGDTAWLRVSEAWAGQKFGTQFLPRIGQEVVVSYIDGDPDRPIVTGRVYNADTSTTNLPFPQSASASTQFSQFKKILTLDETKGNDFARSGIETRSTPMPRGPDGKPTGTVRYHLLRFDDNYNNEQLLMRSQGRLDVTAKASSYQTTEGDRHVLCEAGKDKHGNYVGGNLFTTTGMPYFGMEPCGNYDLHIGGDRFEQVDGPAYGYQLTVKKDMLLDIEKNLSGIVKETLSFNAKNIIIEASQKITLMVGQSTLVLSPSTHYLDGPMICKQQDGPADPTPDLTFQNVVDATHADPGEPPGKRASGRKGGAGSGQRGSHTVPSQHAISCGMDDDNMLSVPLSQLCTADGDGG